MSLLVGPLSGSANTHTHTHMCTHIYICKSLHEYMQINPVQSNTTGYILVPPSIRHNFSFVPV